MIVEDHPGTPMPQYVRVPAAEMSSVIGEE
jgi:hypothetical protein